MNRPPDPWTTRTLGSPRAAAHLTWSWLPQCSTIFPFATREMSMPDTLTVFPVAGLPINDPGLAPGRHPAAQVRNARELLLLGLARLSQLLRRGVNVSCRLFVVDVPVLSGLFHVRLRNIAGLVALVRFVASTIHAHPDSWSPFPFLDKSIVSHNNSAGKRARPKPTWGRSSERGPHASEPSDRSGRSGDGALRAVAPQRQRNARDTGSRDDERLTDPWVHWPEKCFVRCGHIAVARLAPMASPAVGESLLSSQSPPGFRPRLSLRGAPRPA